MSKRRNKRENMKKKKKGKVRKTLFKLSFLTLFIAFLCYVILLIFLGTRSSWDGEERISFALHQVNKESGESRVFVVSYSPSEGTISVLEFPNRMKIETAGDYGHWRVESIFPFGENEGDGGNLLKMSLSAYLGIEIEGWIYSEVSSVFINDGKDFVGSLTEIIVDQLIGGSQRTDLLSWDGIRLLRGIRSVLPSRVTIVDLAESNTLSSELQPDGIIEYFSDAVLLDDLSSRLFSESRLKKENLTVMTLNSTQHDGLGRKAARLVENMGAKVVVVRDSDVHLEKSKLIINPEETEKTFTYLKLRQLFNIDEQNVEKVSDERSDITLIVGEDYWRSFAELN